MLLLFFEPPAPVACADPVATVDATSPKHTSATRSRRRDRNRRDWERKDGLTGYGGGVRRVVVRLDVRVGHGQVVARDDGLDRERGLVREGVGEDVARGDLDRLLEQVVLEDDEARVDRRRVAEDVLPVEEHLLDRRGAAVDVEV